MNVETLKQFVGFLLENESRLGIQACLTNARDQINNLVNNPTQQQFQSEFASALNNLKESLAQFRSATTPAQIDILSRIGGYLFFSEEMTNEIDGLAQQNSITPAVVRDYINKVLSDRESYLASLNQLNSSLNAIGASIVTLPEGSAELGLTLPRALFDNKVDRFTSELRRLDLMFRFFGEVTTGEAEHATLGEISSTNPLIFFGLPPDTILQVAKAFKWAVDQLAAIAKLRDTIDALRGQGLTKAQVKVIEDAANEKAKEAVDAKVTELLSLRPPAGDRYNSVEKGLRWSLETIMASVERGVTVELRFIPPPQQEAPPESAAAATFVGLHETAQQLAFPPAAAAPVLELPPPEPPADPPEAAAE